MAATTYPSARHRRFHIGDVLSILTGLVVSPRGLAGVRALYEHLAGRSMSFYEVQESSISYRQYLAELFPALAEHAPAEVPLEEFVAEWVDRRAREFGRYLEVPPIARGHALYPRPWQPPATATPGPYWRWPTHGVPWLVRPWTARDDATFWRPVLTPPEPLQMNGDTQATATGSPEKLVRDVDPTNC